MISISGFTYGMLLTLRIKECDRHLIIPVQGFCDVCKALIVFIQRIVRIAQRAVMQRHDGAFRIADRHGKVNVQILCVNVRDIDVIRAVRRCRRPDSPADLSWLFSELPAAGYLRAYAGVSPPRLVILYRAGPIRITI